MITDESVADFISFTGAGADEARSYLEMAGGELQQAVNLFLEMGGGGGGTPARAPAPSPPSPDGSGYVGGGPRRAVPEEGVIDADVAAEVAAVAAAAGIDMSDTSMAEPAEVRAPMAAFQDQIISPENERRAQAQMEAAMAADTAASSRRMSFDRPAPSAVGGMPNRRSVDSTGADAEMEDAEAGGSAINQLFAPPPYNDAGPFMAIVEKAKAEAKWLLVNIQQAEVFASHQLNRDVWSDETITDVVTGSCIFWQRDDKSTEGSQFCQYYQCGHQLPIICAIDPRTGRKVKSWDGRKWVESHVAAEFLFGFLDEYSMNRTPAMSPAGSPSVGPSPAPDAAEMAAGVAPAMSLTGLGDGEDTPMETTEAVKVEEPACALPDEPSEDQECVKVSLKLPSGQRVTRRFLTDGCVESMFVVASALSEKPMRLVDLSTQFPTTALRDIAGGIETAKVRDAKVAGSMVMVSIRPA